MRTAKIKMKWGNICERKDRNLIYYKHTCEWGGWWVRKFTLRRTDAMVVVYIFTAHYTQSIVLRLHFELRPTIVSSFFIVVDINELKNVLYLIEINTHTRVRHKMLWFCSIRLPKYSPSSIAVLIQASFCTLYLHDFLHQIGRIKSTTLISSPAGNEFNCCLNTR